MGPEYFEVLFELAMLDPEKSVLPTNREEYFHENPEETLEKAA